MNPAIFRVRHFGPMLLRLIAGVVLMIGALTSSARESVAQKIAGRLDAAHADISTELAAALKTNSVNGSYTTVWRQFEEQAIAALKNLLPRHIPEITQTNFDSGTTGREKNRLADLAVTIGGEQIEISVKTARKSANPENDMGTFRDHPNRKKLFAASFTVWVRYEETETGIQCDRVFFDRTWRFVGKATSVDGVKYRKKDGNMRPKPWAMFDSGKAYWSSEAEFEAAVKRSEVYRANEIIKEYLDDLSEDDQRLLYEKLKAQFADEKK